MINLDIDLELGKQILDLKNEVGYLFFFRLPEFELISRPLLVGEIETIYSLNSIIPEYIVHEWIFNKCIKWSSVNQEYFFTKAKAGLLSSISESILKHSNSGDIESVRDKLADEDKIHDGLSVKLLSRAPGFNIPDRAKLTRKSQLEFIARVEHLFDEIFLGDKQGHKSNKKSKSKHYLASKEAADKVDIDLDNKALHNL